MTEINSLINQRTALKAKLTRFRNSLDNYDWSNSRNDLIMIETKIADIKNIITEYERIQTAIESIEPTSAESDQRDRFENAYYTTLTNYLAKQEELRPPTSAVSQDTPGQSRENSPLPRQNNMLNVKLPAITLPTFSGQYTEWQSFYDTFDSIINKNSGISEVERFHYLKTSLSGDALRAIDTLSLTADNYSIAWSTLKSRYENKRLIVLEHVNAILNLGNLTKSPQSLLTLLDSTRLNLESLRKLGVPVQHWDLILIPILTSKFDFATKREYEKQLVNNELPTLDNLLKFLERSHQLLESLNTQVTQGSSYSTNKTFVKQKPRITAMTQNVVNCPSCSGPHLIYNCEKLLQMDGSARYKHVQQLRLCTNCLKHNHKAAFCKSGPCRTCNRRHHTLLHVNSAPPPTAGAPAIIAEQGENNTLVSGHCGANTLAQVILSTAFVLVTDQSGRRHKCRAFLDVGSQVNLVTAGFVNKIKAQTSSIQQEITGVSGTCKINEFVNFNISSRFNNFSVQVGCLVINNICGNIPQQSFSKSTLKIPEKLPLADETFNLSSPIDLLLGAELFMSLLSSERLEIGDMGLFLQSTKLGYIVSGRLSPGHFHASSIASFIACQEFPDKKEGSLKNDQKLSRQISKFWELDECTEDHKLLTSQEIIAEEHFQSSFQRTAGDRRFMVGLPVKGKGIDLGSSDKVALKRFYSLERKFKNDPLFKGQYSSFMQEYLQLGHMERVRSSPEFPPPEKQYYLPHHAVFKNGSNKIRVVFDGSCPSSNGLSLNDNLLKGPVIQPDLFDILVRFRTFQFVLSADIVKMYRCIKLAPEYRDLHRIFWRDSADKPVETYRLTTVTYGTTPASFLATRCLKQLAIDVSEEFPLAAEAISSHFYVDDLLTGPSTKEETILLREQVAAVLSAAGFHLSKWASNSPDLLPANHSQRADSATLDLSDVAEAKTLGVLWNSSEDVLKYETKVVQTTIHFTKRQILSNIAKIFDPLGLLAPIIVNAKIIMQQLWLLQINWDTIVPAATANSWVRFLNELQHLNDIQVERKVIAASPSHIELHGFSDSSKQAYGACIFVKSTDENGQSTIQLLAAKSRVAPLKELTIPRLELCAALMLSRLHLKVMKTILPNIKVDGQFFWTDSQIVLAWIKQPASHWNIFVANRVAEIQSNTPTDRWFYVASEQNPADIITRGATPRKLAQNPLWWHGPKFLTQPTSDYPLEDNATMNGTIPEERKKALPLINQESQRFSLFEATHSFAKIKRFAAYWLRFIEHLKSHKRVCTRGPITLQELNNAEIRILKNVQANSFAPEIINLNNGRPVEDNSKLKSLDPFLDADGLIRVGGRLRKAHIEYAHKHPCILPACHSITRSIILREHMQHMHSGVQLTLACLRLRYWPISAKNAVKIVIKGCIRCFRARPLSISQKMGDLPEHRISPVRPFLNVGVDYAGPICILDGHGRGKKTIKAYLALFVCFSTKAIHLELVCDLTTDSFLNALKRFVARRGNVANIYSDNAKNFVSANRELQDLGKFLASQTFERCVINSLKNDNQLVWHFIPVNSPTFGGLWEAGIKSAKYHIKRVVGEAHLTYDEMSTLLCGVEACLNSRPLTPLSSDPNDLCPLTPGHFLIGEPMTAPVEADHIEVKTNRLSRWQRVEKIRQHFWRRFHQEYLTQLQGRTKWRKSSDKAIAPGDLVIIKEDNTPPLCWKMGRVIQTHPGSDGVVRVVSLKTATGTTKRAVGRICKLPLEH